MSQKKLHPPPLTLVVPTFVGVMGGIGIGRGEGYKKGWNYELA